MVGTIKELKSIDLYSLARLMGFLGLIIGILVAIFVTIFNGFSFWIIIIIAGYTLIYIFFSLFFGWIYNLLAKKLGGIKLGF